MNKKSPLDHPENQQKINDFLIEHAPTINLHVTKLKNEGKIPEGVDEGDLHMAGFQGLMEALHRYKPDLGANFSTYAGTRIRGKMLDHIVEQGAIPKSIMTQASKIRNLKPGQG